MIKEFTINCNFKTAKAPVTFYVGDPSDENHPIHFQSKWLSEKKGGSVPKEIFDSFAELQNIAIKNHVSFQELCGFVIEEINSNKATINERSRINKNLTIIQKREIEKQSISAEQVPAAPTLEASTAIISPAAEAPKTPVEKAPEAPMQNTTNQKQ